MKSFYNHNGKLFETSSPAISISNHNYRYGDGIFETMKLINGTLPLAGYHFERLFTGMKTLGFKIPVSFLKEKLETEILQLSEKNNCTTLARVRLIVSRGNGGVNDCDDLVQYTIECTAADENINRLNENGFNIDIFPDALKSCDKFSNLKSSNYLSYIMAAKFARENKLNDAFILNQYHRICEASIANVFWIKNGKIYTPPLSEGCVAGIMRKFLIEKIKNATGQLGEKILTEEILLDADELFLTNAVFGMKWVHQFKNKHYSNEQCKQIFQSFISPLYK